jgi:hypothetical protein
MFCYMLKSLQGRGRNTELRGTPVIGTTIRRVSMPEMHNLGAVHLSNATSTYVSRLLKGPLSNTR